MIKCKLHGRIGNMLYQYVLCRIIADRNSYNFYIPTLGDSDVSPSTEGQHLLNFFPDIDLGKKDGDILYQYHEDHTIQRYDENIFNIPNYTLISGFFQTDKYYKGYEDRIKSWIRIILDNETKNILYNYNINDYCYIHLRGTDYKNHTHWFLEKDYYSNAMSYIKSIYPKIKFLIVTDDLDTSKQMFPNIDSISNDMMIDFKLLYYSKYCIVSNSTFSWWAAWIGNKEITIAPNNWLNYNKPELGFYPVDIKTEKFIYI